MSDRRGFTLIEIMTVVIIAGALMLLGFPRLNQAFVSASVNGGTSAVASSFARARAVAVETGRASRLRFNGNSVYVTASPRQNPGAGTMDTVGPIQNLGQQFGVTVAVSDTTLGFDPRGFGLNTSTVSAVISKASTMDTLRISAFGRVQP
jgi:prepilin-type N-terminal cleavage/methylation domain-containing protein